SEGKAILCLTNSIDEVYDLADTISILRNGTIILTDSAVNLDKINLIKLCYSQMEEEDLSDQFREFYQLLQYNEAILQKLPINLIVTDDNNIIRMVNDHGKSYFHLEESSYRGLPLRDLFIDKNIETYQNITTAFLTKQERMLYNVPLIIGDQEAITNIKILPIYDGTTLIGNITIIEDITRQENYRQQVILSEKLASVGILAAGVAHEINNPLEIIYNHLNYMKFKPDREKVDEAIANIEEELGDISQIISNLISFSDSSKMSSEIFDLNDLTANLINLIKFNAKTRQIKIEFFPFSQPIYLNINKNEMKQVILNLMKNSFEASQEDGSISIKTSIEKRGLENVALFIFDDDGSGIVVENMDNIFLPFFSTKSANQNNLGLGLSVSYGIIKKYNGRITAENLQSGGCRFSIQIPVHQD
ncbi:MAG: ATP-binding protein, partial [Desulfobulbia bacterium]